MRRISKISSAKHKEADPNSNVASETRPRITAKKARIAKHRSKGVKKRDMEGCMG